MLGRWPVAVLIAALFGAGPSHAQLGPVDLAVVLAMDVSGSIDRERWELQRRATAEIISSKEFADAARRGVHGRIAVAVVQWSTRPKTMIGWTVLATEAEFAALALRIQGMQRASSGATCLADVLNHAGSLLASWSGNAVRRVIDVSGDGQENCQTEALQNDSYTKTARDRAIAAGITINGLPITTAFEPAVAGWYANNVIGGPRSFLIEAKGLDDFARAMRAKLIVEVAATD
ncbi:MAG: DUF1194 domain-containing protein [Proteobacteria bacterium]|nr:DUF1194 domain-containing protein [Pseudomonadota bacterium]MBI3495933.1 DUF1194 domain-containing protein [Pseudomonadota bacterium]